MENIINQLMQLNSNNFLVYSIQNAIRFNMDSRLIIDQIISQADDNPTLMERTLGTKLFNQIQNVAV